MSDAWIPVVGTLLGGALGFVGSFLIERSRRRHEASHRFEGERRAAFVRLIEAAAAAERAIRDRQVDLQVRRERPDLSAELRPAVDFEKVDVAIAEIALLSRFSAEVRARMLGHALHALDYAKEPWSDDESDDEYETRWRKASSDVHDERREFIDAAKADLDLPRGLVSDWQRRRWRLRHRLGLARRPKAEPPSDAHRDA